MLRRTPLAAGRQKRFVCASRRSDVRILRGRVLDAIRKLSALGRPHRGLLYASFLFMAVVGATTGAYAWLMGPALRAVLTGAGSFDVRQLALATLAIGAVKGAAYLAQFYLVGLFGQR